LDRRVKVEERLFDKSHLVEEEEIHEVLERERCLIRFIIIIKKRL
jgi:hypothetical protein